MVARYGLAQSLSWLALQPQNTEQQTAVNPADPARPCLHRYESRIIRACKGKEDMEKWMAENKATIPTIK